MHNHNAQLHSLLHSTGLIDQKSSLVLGFTSGRTEHSSEMDAAEAVELIGYLRRQPDKDFEKADKMRKKIISMAHEMGWHHLVNGRYKIDMARLNNWCMKYSYMHKALNAYSVRSLPRLVTQFEGVYKSYLNQL